MNKETKTRTVLYNLVRIVSLAVCLLTLSLKYDVSFLGNILVTTACVAWGITCAFDIAEVNK